LTPTGDKSKQLAKRQTLPDTYPVFLQELKQRIRESQLRAAVLVNRELLLLYWRIGRDILVRQERENWGAKVIDRLAADLKKAFPEMKGFSPRNLKYMRAFAGAWPEEEFVQEVLAQITWYHNLTLLEKLTIESDRAGMRKRVPNTAGAATCSCIRLRRDCTSARELR